MNGMDPNIIAAFMQDPELMALIQRPGVMAKLQRLMQDPASAAAAAASDPDLQRIMARFQQSSAPGFTPSFAAPAAAVGSAGGTVTEIVSIGHFNQQMGAAGDHLVLVDFFAQWCGPCKMIAPAIDRMARAFAGRVVFLKVDVDRVGELARDKGIRAMPTFHLYRHGRLLQETSGADERAISRMIERHQLNVPQTQPQVEASPYKTLPLRDDEWCTFKALKADAVKDKAFEFQDMLDAELKMTPEEKLLLSSFVDTIADVASYHRSSVNDAEAALVIKLVSEWPVSALPPVLNLLRAAVLHPHMIDRLATRFDTVMTAVIKHVDVNHPDISQAVLRTLCNMLTRRKLGKLIIEAHCERVIDVALRCVEASSPIALRVATASLFINFSIALLYREKSASEAKIHCLSAIDQALRGERNPKVAMRLLVALGSLAYRDETVKSIAKSLDVASGVNAIVDSMSQGGDTGVSPIARDVLSCLE